MKHNESTDPKNNAQNLSAADLLSKLKENISQIEASEKKNEASPAGISADDVEAPRLFETPLEQPKVQEPENIDIEALMRKYLSEEDRHYATPMDLSEYDMLPEETDQAQTASDEAEADKQASDESAFSKTPDDATIMSDGFAQESERMASFDENAETPDVPEELPAEELDSDDSPIGEVAVIGEAAASDEVLPPEKEASQPIGIPAGMADAIRRAEARRREQSGNDSISAADETEPTQRNDEMPQFTEEFGITPETETPSLVGRLFSKLRGIGASAKGSDASGDPQLTEDFEEKDADRQRVIEIPRPRTSAKKAEPISAGRRTVSSDPNEQGTTPEELLPVAENAEQQEKLPEDSAPHSEAADDSFDETDAKIMIAFGMEDQLAQTVGFDRVSEMSDAFEQEGERAESAPKRKHFYDAASEPSFEYTSSNQTKSIFEQYKKEYVGILIRMAICAVLLIVTFLFENIGIFGGRLPASMDAAYYPVVHVLVDLQFLVIAGALIYDQLFEGLKAIFRLKPITDSVMVIGIAVTLLYDLICAICGTFHAVHLYHFPLVFGVLLSLFFRYMNTKREIYNFNIVSSKRVKYAIDKLDPDSATLESDTFREYLPENPTMFKINKAAFVDGFYHRIKRSEKEQPVLMASIPAILIAALVFCIVGAIVARDFYSGIVIGYLLFLFALPLSSLIAHSLPFYRASKTAFSINSAIIGEEALQEYAGASAISFDDRDVFPASGVKVKCVKVYGNYRIDHVLYNVASFFHTVGGPLSEVFDAATRDLGHSENVTILSIHENGVEAVVDQTRICLGKASYLCDMGIPPIVDTDDATMENSINTSIMYMVINDEVAAKMYIQYVMDRDFQQAVKHLYKIGVCVGIKTFDPNIDDEMLSASIKTSKYPVRILKCRDLSDLQVTAEHTESGIISRGSAKSLLQTMSLCDRVSDATKTNTAIKIFSMILSLVVSGAILGLGLILKVPSVYIVLYQLFWTLPMWLMSTLFVGKQM